MDTIKRLEAFVVIVERPGNQGTEVYGPIWSRTAAEQEHQRLSRITAALYKYDPAGHASVQVAELLSPGTEFDA